MMTTATAKTFRDAYRNHETVVINGAKWLAWDLSVCGAEVILTRSVKVATYHTIRGLKGGGWRLISIRRPTDAAI